MRVPPELRVDGLLFSIRRYRQMLSPGSKILLFSCTLAVNGQQCRTYDNLSGVVWTRSSSEQAALARQVFRGAEQSLSRALEDPHWTAALEQGAGFENLPPAVILDLDETVLDNSGYQARLLREGKAASAPEWERWVGEQKAAALPGAVEFLEYARLEGVTAFYVTNRVCDPGSAADPTVSLLRRLSVPLGEGRLLCKAKEPDSGDKSARRAKVAASHRVLLLIGDDLNDFLTAPDSREGRDYQLRIHERFFGERWFILPNPMYGSWERVAGMDTAKKLESLKP
jgi:acid phosphatase